MSRTGSPSRLVLALIGAAALVAPAIEASGTGAAVATRFRLQVPTGPPPPGAQPVTGDETYE